MRVVSWRRNHSASGYNAVSHSGRNGRITPAVLGVPNASKHGTMLEVAHNGADWLRNPCRLRD